MKLRTPRRIPAFINYNLTDKGLTHCISVAKPRLVVFDADLAAPIADIASDLANAHSDLRFVRWVDEFYSGSPGEKSISLPDEVSAKEVVLTEAELSRCSASRVPDERRNGITWHSTCMLIYTSGTTGLPKAAIVLHSRCRGAAQVRSFLLPRRSSLDALANALPRALGASNGAREREFRTR